jgi:phosphinothricin acetyltransferase
VTDAAPSLREHAPSRGAPRGGIGSASRRDATIADLPRIVDIYNATVPGRMVTADTEPVSVDSRRAWFAAHTPQRRPIWVVERDGAVAGWASFSDFYGRPAYDGTAEVSIYLAPEHQRRGVGGWVLDEACAASPSLGLHTLLGFVFGHNVPSLALFERRGFARWAHLPRIAVLDGVARDLVILGRRVDPA